MSSRNNSADFSPLVSRNAANAVFRDAVRLFIGRGRRYSVKQASIGTGIPARTIESFMAPVDSTDFRRPHLDEFMTLATFLRAEFTSELLAASGQGAFDLPDDEDPPLGDVIADNAADNAEIASAARDGISSPATRQRLAPVALRMVRRGHQLAAMAA